MVAVALAGPLNAWRHQLGPLRAEQEVSGVSDPLEPRLPGAFREVGCMGGMSARARPRYLRNIEMAKSRQVKAAGPPLVTAL